MKHGIELNGVANISLLIDSATTTVVEHETDFLLLSPDIKDSIKSELKLLERYMIAYCKAINSGVNPPAWHEIRENPSQYPDNRGK
jgi:hypothetical protein